MLTYDMEQLSQSPDFQGRLYLTRKNGQRAYRMLRDCLAEAPDGEAVVLLFPAGQVIDASFADETLIRLGAELLNGHLGDRGLLLQGLTEDSVKNIEAVIGSRRLKLGFLAVEPTGEWRCIGHVDPALKEVLDLLFEMNELTAPRLAELMNLAGNNASNRLKRLYDRRLVRREYEVSNKGLLYFYYFWQWTREPLVAARQ